MQDSGISAFADRRQKQNALLQQYAGLEMKRFLSLDHQAYQEGELPAKTKELLGLVASLVLRCDDCISYHLLQCQACGLTNGEFVEALQVALVAGGSITIPHLRRAVAAWDELQNNSAAVELT